MTPVGIFGRFWHTNLDSIKQQYFTHLFLFPDRHDVPLRHGDRGGRRLQLRREVATLHLPIINMGLPAVTGAQFSRVRENLGVDFLMIFVDIIANQLINTFIIHKNPSGATIWEHPCTIFPLNCHPGPPFGVQEYVEQYHSAAVQRVWGEGPHPHTRETPGKNTVAEFRVAYQAPILLFRKMCSGRGHISPLTTSGRGSSAMELTGTWSHFSEF